MSDEMHQIVDEISGLLDDKLRVRGKTLAAQIRKAGRRLPRAVRRDATYIVQSMALTDNPKLSRMVDHKKLQRARANIVRHLEGVDLSEQRRTAALNMVASVAFVILVTGILVLFVLVQRGFV